MRRRSQTTILVRIGLLLVLAGAALAFPPSSAAGVTVWFERGGEPVAVGRRGATIELAVGALLRGPTAAERRRGIASAIPPGTPVRGIEVRRRVVTVDLGVRFASGRQAESLRARVGQLVRTLRSIPGVRAVRVLVEGGVPVGMFPGYDLRREVSGPAPSPASPPGPRATRQLLADLGFMHPSGVTGGDPGQVATAILAFEKWAGLPRDGVLDAGTAAALARATRPEPALRAPGRRIEVQLGRQVALLIEGGKVLRTVHISSGAGGATPTGSFRVFRKERNSWSVPFKAWLPWASYFTGGIAFHEYDPVPTYPASHGCIRVTRHDARMLYGFARFGTAVDVVRERV